LDVVVRDDLGHCGSSSSIAEASVEHADSTHDSNIVTGEPSVNE
jgi:hypothetical protein